MQAYNAEVTAIERDAKAKQNVGSDAAKQRAARGAQALIEAAEQRAKKCQEDAKPAGQSRRRTTARRGPAPAPPTSSARFGRSATLDPAQQSLRREEEIRLQAELNECNRRTR